MQSPHEYRGIDIGGVLVSKRPLLCAYDEAERFDVRGQVWRANLTSLGFGTHLLTNVLPKQLGGQFSIDYEGDGVKAALQFPIR